MKSFTLKKSNSIRKVTGFTLIEVLVAVSVMSIGLLGLAGLQLTALKNSNSAHHRTIATMLANDIADRARANNVGNYTYLGGAAPGLNGNCETVSGCSANQMASNDITRWLRNVNTLLPNATATICNDSTPEVSNSVALADNNNPLPAIVCDGAGNRVVFIDWVDTKNDTGIRNQRFIMSF